MYIGPLEVNPSNLLYINKKKKTRFKMMNLTICVFYVGLCEYVYIFNQKYNNLNYPQNVHDIDIR